MNWGNKIFFVFVLFAGSMIWLVTLCFQQEIPLVTNDYYKEELAYQSRINEKANLELLVNKPSINQSLGSVVLSIKQGEFKGTFKLYRPSDSSLDVEVPFDTKVHNGLVKISKNRLISGKYVAKVSFSDGKHDYYLEEDVFVQ